MVVVVADKRPGAELHPSVEHVRMQPVRCSCS